MAIEFPTALDTTTSLPTVTDVTTDVLAIHQNDPRDAIIAVETKLGYGASTPTVGKFLVGNTDAGTSQWRVLESGDIPDISATYVPKSLFDANTVLYATTDNTPVALEVGASTIVGRKSTGNIVALTATETRTILNVANGATANTKAAGSDITTGTDDEKFVTAKALADATIGKLGAAWSTWTPTVGGFTKGSGSVYAVYTQVGKIVMGRFSLVMAADSSITGSVTFTLPVTSVSHPLTATLDILGGASLFDQSVAAYTGQAVWVNTTTCRIQALKTDAANLTPVSLSSTVPFTWTTNDEIHVVFTYEAA